MKIRKRAQAKALSQFSLVKYVALDTEEWKSLERNDRYEVSTFGQVRLVKPYKNAKPVGYILPIRVDSRYGYAYVDLWRNSKSKRSYVHKLIAETFLGPCLKGLEVRHKDGTRTNSRLDNLCYGTRSENVQDAIRHGTFKQKGVIRHSPEAIEKIGKASKAAWARGCHK